MNFRIQFCPQTVNAMRERLQAAYRRGDVQLVRRISALLGHIVGGEAIETLRARWGFSVATFYNWLTELLRQVGVAYAKASRVWLIVKGRGDRPN